MPRKKSIPDKAPDLAPKDSDIEELDMKDQDLEDGEEDIIPIRRDTSIFNIKKEKYDDDDEFDEDVFV